MTSTFETGTDALRFLTLMPKAEVHVHLEGTIGPETLWALSQRHGIALPAPTLEALRQLYVFESFDAFAELWFAMCSCLRTPKDLEDMVDAYLAECQRQNIKYLEAHFTAFNHERFGIGGARALEVVTNRLHQATEGNDIVVRLIIDIPSESLPESGQYTAELLERTANPLVVGIGLGGPEEGIPRTDAAPYFRRARLAGYPAVAHAGETGGAEHVRQAVQVLHTRRIQHGVHAAADPQTLRLIADMGICCDIALTSNQYLAGFPDLDSHPLPVLLQAGVPVTLSTDDPPFFGTDLIREHQVAYQQMGLSLATLWELNLNGLRYGLADCGLRRRLLLHFRDEAESLGMNAE